MEPPLLRDEAPPDDTVVVVRGGLLAEESIRRTAETSLRIHGFYGVSAFAAIGVTVEDLVRATDELSPARYRQLRTTTVGTLRAAPILLWSARPEPDGVRQ